MFRLETFGGLTLAADADPLRTTQRRRLALLALLAVAGERGLSRDKLQAFLWPESRADQARHALEQLLYFLRRQLGDDVFLGTNPLALNSVVIESDVADFQRSIERGELEKAIELYQGPFLDGFFLSDAPEFERWADGERARLAQCCKSALESLARREAGRDPATGLGWLRRLVAMDPYATGPTLGLMETLANTGDRAGALEVARLHQLLVRDDLDAAPNPEIAALAERVRSGKGLASVRPAPPTPAPMPSGSTSAAAPSVAVEPTRPRPRRALIPRVAVVVALILPVALALTLARRQDAPAGAGALDPGRILVLPFRITAPDSSLNYLGDGMVDLLAARLSGEGRTGTVDARAALSAWKESGSSSGSTPEGEPGRRLARSFGAGKVLTGDVYERAPGRLVLDGAMRSAADGRVLGHATVSGGLDTLPALVDRFVAALLVAGAGEAEPRLAELTSASLPALRAYLDGRAAYRRGDDAQAIADYAQALELDSNFVLAGLELLSASDRVLHWAWGDSVHALPFGQTAGKLQTPGGWARALKVAWSGRERLTNRDRSYLLALVGSHYPDASSARERLTDWEHAVDANPDRADAWYRLGQMLQYQGRAIGLADWAGRAGAAFRRARTLDSSFVAPVEGLLELAAHKRDSAEVRRLAELYLAHDSTSATADYVRWHAAAVVGDVAALQSLRNHWGDLALETLDRIQWTSQVEGIALDDADRAMAELLARSAARAERGGAVFASTMLRLNQGRPRDAQRGWNRMTDYMGTAYLHRSLMYAMYWEGDSALSAVTVRNNPDAFWWVAQWRLWHSDTTGAARAVESLRKLGVQDSNPVPLAQAIYLEAVLAALSHRDDATVLLQQADSVALLGCCSLPHHGNLIVARVHEMAGDLPGALEAVRRQQSWYAPEYLSTALEEEGRLAAMTGDTAGAIRAWEHYLALRQHPEPERRAEVDRVKAELARLK